MAKNILKEAIADAKAVREVALANAKAALEEAFTPKLQSMLSAKLSEDLDEDYYEDGDVDEMMNYDEDGDVDEMATYDEDDNIEEDEDIDEMATYDEDEKESTDEEIDLEEILNELELEGDEADEELVDEAKADDDEEEADLEEIMKPHYEADDVQKTSMDVNLYEDKEFDLDSLLKEINDLDEINETDETEEKEEAKEEVEEAVNPLATELEETKAALETVRAELNEVNLLNSKLLYVNRIFKANNLDEGQKLRVVETLDNADTAKEAKLIYETIKDSFSIAKSEKVSKKAKTLKEGFKGMASKAAGMSTAPKRPVLNESNDMMKRFQKLANIQINQ